MRIFYHIVKEGSLTKAVPVLKIDQPTLTRKLATLEAKLGFTLVKRRAPHSPMKLTEKGEVVFRTAQKAMVMMDLMNTELYDYEGVKGKVRLSTTHAIANYIVGPLLDTFAKENPELEIELMCSDSDINIFSNEVDLAIHPYNSEEEETLIQEHLLTLESHLYASPEYLKEFGTPALPRDLDNHRLLTYPRAKENPYSDVNWILKVGRGEKQNRKPFYTSNSIQNLLRACEAGMGIMPFHKQMEKNRNSKLVPVLENVKGPEFKFYLSIPKSLENVERIKSVKKYLADSIAENSKG